MKSIYKTRAKRSFLAIFAFIILVILGLFLADIFSDRSHQVQITEPVKLYEDCESAGHSSSQTIGEAIPGIQAKILRICYSKDFRVVKIRLENGMEGWVVDGIGVQLTK